MGKTMEQELLEKIATTEKENTELKLASEQTNADVDYVAIMTGVEL
jgi:hypothetical protein